MKKNIAESDCGVACHKKINKVGSRTLGCLTAPHNWVKLFFELSMKPLPKEAPLARPRTGCSFTSTDTADVMSGSNDVAPKTNLAVQKQLD